jgi:ligand-binding sensor domain-containing protein/signal transduction histidine kinase
MIAIRRNTARASRRASRIVLLCVIHCPFAVTAEPNPAKFVMAPGSSPLAHLTAKSAIRPEPKPRHDATPLHSQDVHPQDVHALETDLKFNHLTASDGLSQDNIVAILQDHRGFMWFATGEGLNRYDGNSFVVYKNNPSDPGSLSHNFIRDLVEDDRGYLWVAVHPGINKFDPTTEHSTRYLHDPDNPNSLGSDAVWRITRDHRGYLWFATDNGLDRFDPATETFTHYRNDSSGQFVGRITHVIEDSHRDIWFVGESGLFHLNLQTGQITQPPAIIKSLSANYLYEDKAGDFWMLAHSPIVGLVKYDRHAERITQYPLGAGAAGLESSTLLDDGENGFWVPSNLGLYYFDRRTEHFTRLYHHDDTDPHSLSDNSVVPIYRDRAGLLWVGTQNGGLNILNFQQEEFGHFSHRPADPNTLSPGKATAIYQEPDGVLWVGLFPRALDRLDRNTGKITHYIPGPESGNNLSEGSDLTSIFKDARGYLWVGGWGAGLDRFDERTGMFKHYRHNPGNPHSLMTDHVISIYGDPNGQLWVGQFGAVSRFDPATDRFTNYRLGPDESASLAYTVSAIHRDRSGILWLGTWGGVLSRFDDKTNTFVNYPPDQRDPHRLQGGSIGAIHEDRTGTLWLASGLGLYRYDRQNGTATRYTENQGLPSNDIMGILEDSAGRLWLSTKTGISRFDPKTETFRNYDVSDGLLSNDFSRSCHQQSQNGEMLFCGSNGVTAFFPENIRDDSYVPPVVITSLKIFNKPVPIGANSVLKKAIPYVDSLNLSYRDNVFSFEFAALGFANPQKNRYRYMLENFDRGWNEVNSKQRLATYTNLDPGKYAFRVQGSNGDGIWNEEGASLAIVITPPWWSTNWFRVLCAVLLVTLLWAAYKWRLRLLHRQFEMTVEARVGERTRIARELHDTLLQSFQGLMLRFQIVSQLFPERPAEAMEQLDRTIERAAKAITEGRDAVQGLRASTVETNDLARAVNSLGEELATDPANPAAPAFQVTVEGGPRDLHPILRDEIYRIAAESLRNAFRHAQARQVEVEIRYDNQQFWLRVRDDGKGMDTAVLSGQGPEGHYGLPGMRERGKLIGGKLVIWSEIGAGTEVELCIPAAVAYTTATKRSWISELLAKK